MIRVLHRLRSENGVALPVVMGVLLVVTLIVAATAQSAYRVSDSANEDRSSKRALAAAEAGLQVANNRLNNAPDQAVACFSGAQVGANCPTPVPGDLGNGARYRYWTSPVLAAGETCGSIPTQTATGTQRCITSEGAVNGVVRRVQTRVLNTPGQGSLLPVPGVVGLDSIAMKNNAEIKGRLGTNGTIEMHNNNKAEGVDFGPDAEFTNNQPTYTRSPWAAVTHDAAFALDPVPVGATSLTNKNAFFPTGAGVTYTNTAAAPRSLHLDNADVLLTEPGDYNFCRIVVDKKSKIRVQTGVKVRIFIDAPGAVRPGAPPAGSGCPNGNGWGELTANNDFELNPGGDPANFQLFVVGWTEADHPAYHATHGDPVVEFKNKAVLDGMLYAPNARVVFKNNAEVNGAIASKHLEFHNNFDFVWDSDSSLSEVESKSYNRQGWRECRPTAPTSGDPESGC